MNLKFIGYLQNFEPIFNLYVTFIQHHNKLNVKRIFTNFLQNPTHNSKENIPNTFSPNAPHKISGNFLRNPSSIS